MSDAKTDNAAPSRRGFLKNSFAAAAAAPLAAENAAAQANKKKPNIVMIIADQFRGDFIGANGMNPMGVTPNLDGMAQRGVCMQNAVTNQPLCSPSRACLFTGMYATQTGMWKLPPGVELNRELPTLASILRSNGYSANYIGKWHLAPIDRAAHNTLGFVQPQDRGGFLDLWQASNVLELTSHPYQGTIWDGEGKEMHFKDTYRVNYLTDLAVRFL
jgi:arylsulfatase A-like enzyme